MKTQLGDFTATSVRREIPLMILQKMQEARLLLMVAVFAVV